MGQLRVGQGRMGRMDASQTAPRAPGSIRHRIMWPMILLAGLALLVSGGIVSVIQDRSITAAVDERLERTRDELKVLAQSGVDPQTGDQFTGPSEVLHTFLSRTVLGDAEGEVAFVGDRIEWMASEDQPVRPEDDRALIAAVAPLATGDTIIVDTFRTDRGTYRVLVAPVIYPDGQGALVHVYDMDVARAELRTTMTLYAVVAVVTMVLVALAAWFVVGRLLRPIEELRAAAESIDERDLTTRVPVRGNDDLTALSATINRMLDRVQTSVEGQRRLLDDVGHELRTPITVVRGHLEVVDVDDPVDVAQTRDLAIEEVDRMGGMINDLLMLARATESDFVRPGWADVASLTDQTLGKARALGDRRWRLERVAAAEAWLDVSRMTQAWLQLAANAVKYSEPGSPISLGSRLHRGEVQLWVSDAGIGIAPEQLRLVRERFGRTREAVQHADGAGLGLSIVETIVAAHGGRLEIESVPGEGSTFTMILPISPEKETDA